ncbi:extracellular solute-binding protein [Bacillus niameyensis]|uniref:extracellular solute-binding protein n=1 Tax=Bacillus niameyensis TaxID=1522308 RepID=UPI00078087DB|nr:extracellular solute-binding protein [Bacillus niameyensis]
MSQKPTRMIFDQRMGKMLTSIRHDIQSGKLQNGDYLPSINQLCEIYHLSKNSIQKGLDQLVSEGLIKKIPRVGIQVLGNKSIIRLGYYSSLMRDANLAHQLEAFQKEYNDIQVELVPLPYGNYKEVVTHYLLNDHLDVLFINDNHFSQLTEGEEKLKDLLAPQNMKTEIYPFLHSSFIDSEAVYAQPFVFSPVVFCYNQHHVQSKELDEWAQTWAQFSTYLDQLHTKQKYPFYFYPASTNRWPIFLLQSGVNFQAFLKKDIERLMDGVEACHTLIHNQKIPPAFLLDTDTTVEQLFALGKISIMMTTYFGLNELKDVDFAFDLAPLPYVHEPGTLLLTIGLALNQHSSQKEAGQLLIDFLTSFKQQKALRENTLSIPANAEAAEKTSFKAGTEPLNYRLYQQIHSTYRSLADLGIRKATRQQLLDSLKYYWMGYENKQTTKLLIADIFQQTVTRS